MPRLSRIVIPNIPHHITQRGNNRQDVFFVDDDKIAYLGFLKEQSEKFGLIIEGYCLMTNHVHIIATPKKADSLAKAMGRTNLAYTQYINYMHGRGGHVWQNRFYSCPMGPNYFYKALCYLEQNPIRAKITCYPWTYRWSSASAHIGRNDEFGLIDKGRWSEQSSGLDWKKVLQDRSDGSEITKVSLYCRTGRPLGSDKFISKLEVKLGCRLRALPVGRPNKQKKSELLKSWRDRT